MSLVILAVDLGKTCGVAVAINGDVEFTTSYKHERLEDLWVFVKDLVDRWRPNLILIPYPTRFYRVIMSHSKMMGVIELIAEKKDIQVIEVQDATCKKVVLGNGRAKKDAIMAHFNEENEHIADARLFIAWYLKSI
jgi:Holliday junction resolvasome RuvABC endonuclease subunit